MDILEQLHQLDPLIEEYFPSCFIKIPSSLALKLFPDTDFTKDRITYHTQKSKLKIGVELDLKTNFITFIGSNGEPDKMYSRQLELKGC